MTQRAKRYEVEDDCGQPRATALPQTQLHGVSVVLFRLELRDFPGRIATHAKLQSPSDATVRCTHMGGLLFWPVPSSRHVLPLLDISRCFIVCLTAKLRDLAAPKEERGKRRKRA